MAMRKRTRLIAATLAWLVIPSLAGAGELEQTDQVRGRYLVVLGGCNDCHTPGYAASGGATPEAQWLLGDALGYLGPWGTTYPSNLRSYFAALGVPALQGGAVKQCLEAVSLWFILRTASDQEE